MWSGPELGWHINLQELETVTKACIYFAKHLRGKRVLVRSDNMTVVTYINHQGGTRSSTLCMAVWKLWKWAEKNQVFFKAVHLKGELNCLVDWLSRQTLSETEWSLNPLVGKAIFARFRTPMIDLFATQENWQVIT